MTLTLHLHQQRSSGWGGGGVVTRLAPLTTWRRVVATEKRAVRRCEDGEDVQRLSDAPPILSEALVGICCRGIFWKKHSLKALLPGGWRTAILCLALKST